MSSLIVGNWKSHKTKDAALTWLEAFGQWWQPAAHSDITVAVAPPFPLIPVVAEQIAAKSWPIALAAQDVSAFPPGKYTGAVAVESLSAWPVRYAIVGHSERRRYFHETHQDVANKVSQALAAGITPIVCVDDEYARQQAAALSPEELNRCILAYEPLEAIGSGTPQAVAEVAKVLENIRQSWGNVPMIYGGSVTDDTVASYLELCDGVLVGGASLDVTEFIQLVRAAAHLTL